MFYDDQFYLMPEEIGIPQHVERVLKSPSVPIDFSRTLPSMSKLKSHGGSTPNENLKYQQSTLPRVTYNYKHYYFHH